MDNLADTINTADAQTNTTADTSTAGDVNTDTTQTADVTQIGDTGSQTTNTTQADEKPFYTTMPEDWREQVAKSIGVEGDDLEKLTGQLSRYKDLPALIKSGVDAQTKIRNGETSNGLPENPTDEQIAEYREANGIPETFDKYELSLGEGLVLSDEDDRIMEGVKQAAHGLNIPNEALSLMTSAMLAGRQKEAEAAIAQDGINAQEAERILRDNWGQDFEGNKSALEASMNRLPESVRDLFKNARLQDGRAVLHSAEMINYLVDMERQINPMASVVPNNANAVQAVETEIAALESKMGTSEWYKDEASQKRYQDLVTARDTAAKRR